MKWMSLCILVAVCFVAPNICLAQGSFDETKLIPSSATAAIFANPKALLAEPSMELIPREIITVLGKKELGFDPCEINKVMVLLDTFEDQRQPPGFALVVAFDSPQGLSQKFTQYMEEGELDGKKIFRGGAEEPAVFRPNDKTIVFGMEPFIKKMMAAKGAESKLINLVKSRKNDAHVSAFLTLEPIRGVINESLPPTEQIPLPFRQFTELPNLVDSVVWKMNFAKTQNGTIEIIAIDPASVEKVESTIKVGIEMGRQYAMGMIENEMREQDPELQAAILKYGDRVGEFFNANFSPEKKGNSLIFEGEATGELASIGTIGTLVGMLLPAVQQVREAARRASSMNNLRQIALAAHNYESAHRKFPNGVTTADKKKKLLSWRVQLLPFLEENALYDKFHLDEAWDSDHNIKLLDQMPEIFNNKNAPSKTKTVFLAFSGEGTIFGDQVPVTFGSITDGTSNTIMCVEADREAAIEWTKPDDLPFDMDGVVSGVGNLRPGGFNVALCDGSVFFMSRTIDQKTLKHFIHRSDGNIVDIDNFSARR